ncbi:putative aminomethyltransferase [Diplonema papillatum]|nr:putative aminomethyltransferase [Diplonema papillatum]
MRAAACAQKRFASAAGPLLRTPLYDFHKEKGCKFVDFAGYEMPVTYTGRGLVKEHKAVRESAGIFDVSHMGQWVLTGADREAFLERVTPIDMQSLAVGAGALTVITNENGGIIDDSVVVKQDGYIYMVVNAGCQVKDYAHFTKMMKEFNGDVKLERLDRGLIALQGPKAVDVLGRLCDVSALGFMQQTQASVLGEDMRITRCGYTGEDGFEISASVEKVAELAEALAGSEEVSLAGLGARDTLRLEAGLCLYGNDMTEETSPIEATLAWLISKRRRETKGFVGADVIMRHIEAKPKEDGAFKRKRVCMFVSGPPARHGAAVKDMDGETVGEVCSGTFSPTLGRNIAMAYVNRNLQKAGTPLQVEVRNKCSPAEVTKSPFVPHRYVRSA